ncbi:MAG: carbon-nitrogen hydrolase family protein [Planctomycetes bacterium]|nr:carbon-nitrogen hydrolase family protein [Planctomycetota bacterium]
MKIACVQMDVKLGEVDHNLAAIEERLRETASNGVRLAIFPECAVTGYCFESLDEARPFAQPIPGPATERISALCAELGMFAIFGLIEVDGDSVYNAAVLTGPDGVVGSYRKVHLPFLGVDQHVNFGDRPFTVHDIGGLRVGINICYDSAFPEATRTLALLGADLIALPTNWPPGAECVAAHVLNTRAMENAVYFAASNRVGTERGFDFIGCSRICGTKGETIATSEDTSETILYAEVDPEVSRNKTAIREPGRHAIDRMADRRPEMYGKLIEAHSLPRPGRD